MAYAYDADNRMTAVDYPGTDLDEAYTYDTAQTDCLSGEGFLAGRLAKVVDGSGSTTWCYNRFGDLVRKVQRSNGKAFTLTWYYAPDGRLGWMTYPDGSSLTYGYDAQGRITSIARSPDNMSDEMVLSSADYAPFGQVQRWTFGNGLEHRRSVNQDYRPGFIEDGPIGTPGPGLDLGYAFDAVGNLKQLNAADQFTVKRRYTHDGQDRLTLVENAALVDLQAYDHDATGNRATFNDGTSQAYSYASGTHRLASVAGVARAYDAAGNLETVGSPATRSYGYNAANRMATATIGGTTAIYRYNALGQRVRKTVASSDRYSVHDDAGRWIGDYDHSGNALQQIVWFGDLPVTVLVGSGSGQKGYYIQADALGTPRVVIDPSRDPLSVGGTVIWRWDLEGEAFGATAPNQDPDGDSTDFLFDMRFPGQRYDTHTGLNYNYFRDYENVTGRFIQSDPVGLIAGTDTHGYVSNRPLIFTDPYGLLKIYELEGVTFHAFSKGSGRPGEPAEHARRGEGDEYHFHLDGPAGPKVNAYTGQPLTPTDAKKMTPRHRAACKALNEHERRFLRKATREVFHNNGTVLKALQAKLKRRVAAGAGGLLLRYGSTTTVDEECPLITDTDAYDNLCPL